MVREITKDQMLLQTVSLKVAKIDDHINQIIKDLIDTATEYKDRCVGLAAIQIGEPFRILVAYNGEKYVPYINPVITKYLGSTYESEEGCMSLVGTRSVTRYEGVEIMHQVGKKFMKERFGGFYAQILQHEIDHLQGKLI